MSKKKKYQLIAIIVAFVLFLVFLFFQGVFLAYDARTYCRVLGDAFLSVTLIFFSGWLLFMAWYNGIFDPITYHTSGSFTAHLKNGKLIKKRSMADYSKEKKEARTKPTYLLWIWLATLGPAIIFSVIAILLTK